LNLKIIFYIYLSDITKKNNNHLFIKKEELKNKIEPHIYDNLTLNEYFLVSEKSSKLLSTNRLDVGFKLFYLEYFIKNRALSRLVYYKSLKANKLFSITEYGNKEKNSLEAFEKVFIELFDEIKKNGFDTDKSCLLLNTNKELLNGSHRLAITSFLGSKISYIITEHKEYENQNYTYFFKRNINQNLIEKAVLSFIRFSDDIHIAFIWPRANITNSNLKSKFQNILYYKEINFNFSAAHHLISEVYSGDYWTGNYKDRFKGSIGKVKECFTSNNALRVIYFKEHDVKKIAYIKGSIREECKAGKHSIHITDNKDEVDKTSKIILNDNTINFLNKANILKFKENFNVISDFKIFLKENKIDFESVVVDSSFIMSLYGIRRAKDLDFIYPNNQKNQKSLFFNKVNESDLEYHDLSIKDLVYDSKNFFYFQGIKFLTLDTIFIKKKNRGEIKDLTDIKLIESYLENNNLKLFYNNLKQKHYYLIVIFKVYSIKFLKLIGMHSFIKKIVKSIFRNNE